MIFKKTSRQSGFSLLELLLSTFVLAGILVIIFSIMENYAQRVQAKSQAAYISKIALAVQEILKNPNYYQAIYTDVDARNPELIELTANDLLNGFTANGVAIPPSNVLNVNIRDNNSSIIIGKADNGTNETLSVLVAHTELVDIKQAKKISSFLEEHGAIYDGNSSDITSAYNSWSFPLTSIRNTQIRRNIRNSPPTQDEIYYFHYSHVPLEYLTGDYLYRVAVPGQPELNRMYAPLNMGNNNILGADDISALGDMTLSSGAVIAKPFTVNRNALIEGGDLTADGTLSTRNALIRGIASSGKRGNLTVDGVVNVTRTATVETELNASEALLSNGVSTTGDINVDRIDTNGSINANNIFTSTARTTNNSNRQNINVSRQIGVNTITTNNINLQRGNVGIIDGVINNRLTVQNNITANKIEINNLNTNSFGACDNGC